MRVAKTKATESRDYDFPRVATNGSDLTGDDVTREVGWDVTEMSSRESEGLNSQSATRIVLPSLKCGSLI
jgi:hypothetical protein